MLTSGTTITLILVPLLLLGLFLAYRWFGRLLRTADDFDRPFWIGGRIAAVVVAVTVIIATALGMYPYRAEYHTWQPVTGIVDTVDSRLMSTGKNAPEQKYVVTFIGNPQQYGVLDARMAGVRVGYTLSITCVRQWQWSGTDGYDCNFVSYRAP